MEGRENAHEEDGDDGPRQELTAYLEGARLFDARPEVSIRT
jgi:hypothetical protein